MADLSTMSTEQLMQIAGVQGPMPASTPDYSSYSNEQLMQIAGIEQPQRSWGGAALDAGKQFASGAVENTASLGGMLADVMGKITNPLSVKPTFNQQTGEIEQNFFSMPYTQQAVEAVQPYIAEPKDDAVSRYSRTVGEFVGPGGAMGAFAKGGKLAKAMMLGTDAAAGIGAQAAEDITGDGTIAPVVGALAGGLVPTLAKSGTGIARSIFKSTPDEIKGTAAKAFRDATDLSPRQLEEAMANKPFTELDSYRTTAELTGNARVAQLERTLGAENQFSGNYNTSKQAREGLRDKLLDETTSIKGVNNEGLGSRIIETGTKQQKALSEKANLLWQEVPQDVPINTSLGASEVKQIVRSKPGGLDPKSPVRTLLSQYVEMKHTSGSLQAIREDALALLRDTNLTPYEERILKSVQGNIVKDMNRGMKGESFKAWEQARDATRDLHETYQRGTAGGSIVDINGRPSTVLKRAFKGDAQSVSEIKKALGKNPELIEEIKRGILDSIPRDQYGQLTNAGMRRFLGANGSGLRKLFGEKHYAQMLKVSEDLKSSAGVQRMADRASVGNSVTQQRQTVAGGIADILTNASTSGSYGLTKRFISEVKKKFGVDDVGAIKEHLYSAVMSPEYALELSKTPTDQRIKTVLERLGDLMGDVGRQGSKTALLASNRSALPVESSDAQQPYLSPSRLTSPSAGSPVSQSTQQPPAYYQNSSTGSGQAPQEYRKEVGSSYQNSPTPIMEPKSNPKQNISYTPEKVKEIVADQPPLIRAMVKQESGGKPKARSNKGASGLMQILPSTAKEIASELGVEDYDLEDPLTSLIFGKHYIQKMYQEFNDPRLALAAYNAGPGKVKQWIKRWGRDWSTISRGLANTNQFSETRNYVRNIVNNAKEYA